MEARAEICDLFKRLRDHQNDTPPVHWHLRLRDGRPRWVTVTAALDIAEDTWAAIAAYPLQREDGSLGEIVLGIYGLLQAMYVQQDAVRALFGCFEGIDGAGDRRLRFAWDDYPHWKKVRAVRNEVAGHPAGAWQGGEDNRKKERAVHGLARIDLRWRSFSYLSSAVSAERKNEYKRQEVGTLIAWQARDLSRALRALVDACDAHEQAYVARLREEAVIWNAAFSEVAGQVGRLLREGTPERAADALKRVLHDTRRLGKAIRKAGAHVRVYGGIDGSYENVIDNARAALDAIARDDDAARIEGFLKEVEEEARWLAACLARLKEDVGGDDGAAR